MPEGQPSRDTLLKGFVIGAAATAGGVMLGLLTMTVGFGIFVLVGYGLVQLVWQVPLYVHFLRKRESETAKGVLLAVAIVVLVNAGCRGVMGIPYLRAMSRGFHA